ncbi:MAG TPA: hypothetical protein VGX48_14425 [Pyrinomonadaceae bacterium]|jgi:hypothetical protein|nr:hypothetical protein [Pyrinomonadaceae bacterium]
MPSTTTQAAPVSEYAIIVSPEDNPAVVKREAAPGLEVELPGGRVVAVRDSVTPGHRFATRDIGLSAGGRVAAPAEEHKHRGFQFRAEQAVSL